MKGSVLLVDDTFFLTIKSSKFVMLIMNLSIFVRFLQQVEVAQFGIILVGTTLYSIHIKFCPCLCS